MDSNLLAQNFALLHSTPFLELYVQPVEICLLFDLEQFAKGVIKSRGDGHIPPATNPEQLCPIIKTAVTAIERCRVELSGIPIRKFGSF